MCQDASWAAFDLPKPTCYSKSAIRTVKINNQITAEEVRVFDQSGATLGVMSKEDALARAREQDLDLIEVVSQAKPPVVRIMSFDKFRYQEEKKQKRQRAGQKKQEFKQVQISVRSAKNDLEMKAKRVDGFLERGGQVTVVMRMRGREKAHKGFALNKLDEFLGMLTVEHQRISTPKFGGRGFSMQIIKK